MKAALLAAALIAWPACTDEAPLDVASDVDLTRFQGKWYEIARLPRLTETDCFGTTAFYNKAPDGSLSLVHQCNVGNSAGPLNTVSMLATVPRASEPAKLSLQVGGYSGDYWILDVGPQYQYAVIGHPSRSYLWILSRSPDLDSTTLGAILARAENQHFDTSKLEFTPQPPAGERVSSDGPVGPVPPAMSTGCHVAGGLRGPRKWSFTGASTGLSAVVAAVLIARRRRSRRKDAPASAAQTG